MNNPYKEKKSTRKKKEGAGGDARLLRGANSITNKGKFPELDLFPNIRGEYKPFEFANYPMVTVYDKHGEASIPDGKKDKAGPSETVQKPRNHVFRMRIPADCDWSGREHKDVESI